MVIEETFKKIIKDSVFWMATNQQRKFVRLYISHLQGAFYDTQNQTHSHKTPLFQSVMENTFLGGEFSIFRIFTK